MQRFADTTTIITGASRGIGFAIAERLVAEGGSVLITGRDPGRLGEAVAHLGAAATGVAGHAADPDHQDAVFAAVAERGGVDHLVNNTGINPVYAPLTRTDPDAVRKIFAVNVEAAIAWTAKAVAAGLRRSMVNVASVAGIGASPGIGAYGASKAALLNLTVQFAEELAPAVRVNAVAPAVVKTAFARALYEGRESEVAAAYPLDRLGEPRDVAGAVAFLLSDDAAWMTGQTLVIDGGIGIRQMA